MTGMIRSLCFHSNREFFQSNWTGFKSLVEKESQCASVIFDWWIFPRFRYPVPYKTQGRPERSFVHSIPSSWRLLWTRFMLAAYLTHILDCHGISCVCAGPGNSIMARRHGAWGSSPRAQPHHDEQCKTHTFDVSTSILPFALCWGCC